MRQNVCVRARARAHAIDDDGYVGRRRSPPRTRRLTCGFTRHSRAINAEWWHVHAYSTWDSFGPVGFGGKGASGAGAQTNMQSNKPIKI